MASSSNPPTAFTLRPWPQGDKKPKSLGEFINRVNFERNGFRNVTEESLRKEIEAQEKSADAPSDGDMSVGPDKEEDPASVRDIRTVRDEMLRNVEVAHQTAMITLDFISLLLSKESPVQAGSTLSALARESVGIGTLGASVLGSSSPAPQKLQENKLIATGRRLLGISETVDFVLSSATRLHREISLETKYWAEVLAVSENGWSVSRLPHEKHSLGVKFGFSEAASEFRNSSVAPMRRADDGTVSLDCGRLGGESQRMTVAIERDGKVVGRSQVPKPLPEDAPLEDRVLEARNSAFAQELWHEINREGRSLLSYDIRLESDHVSYSPDPTSRVVFRLVSLTGDEAQLGVIESRERDGEAEAISATLNLLLGHAHRLNNRKRSQFNAAGNAQRANPPYALLRPIITHLLHEDSIRKAAAFFSELTTVLQAAGLSAAEYTLTEPPITTGPLQGQSTSTSEALITSLLSPLDFQIDLDITPSARIKVHGRTFPSPIATQYQIHLLPPANSSDAEANPLSSSFPPSEFYPDLREVVYYVRQAVARALADHFEGLVAQWSAAVDKSNAPDERSAEWMVSVKGTTICDANVDRSGVNFEVLASGRTTDGASGDDDDNLGRADGRTELRAYGAWRAADKNAQRVWTWSADDVVRGEHRPTLEEVVQAIVSGTATP